MKWNRKMYVCTKCKVWFFTQEGRENHDKICIGYVPESLKNGYKHFYGKVDEKEYNRLKELYEDEIESTPVRVDYEYSINADLSISLDFAAECRLCHAKWRHDGVIK